MNINWYPGHMKKTKEALQKNLKLVDVVIELLDARIPMSSRNPEIDNIVGDKNRIIILNKRDLSDENLNNIWVEYFDKKGIKTILIDATNKKDIKKLINTIKESMKEKIEKLKSKGIKNRPIRAMIVGIPNVGKSTLINSLAGRKSAKTGNRPGVTKGNQWIKLKGNLELLDTPGILWPKFEDQKTGLNLAFTGAIKDEIMDIETLALRLVERLIKNASKDLENRYNIEVGEAEPLGVLEEIAVKRGAIMKGKEVDYTRVAHILLDEFRRGIIGRITIETPEDL
ncbi:ribosome biogenesis GTPase YlqF [Dethiothermospora halolimnae]|uniref:ribosome biogenesis GTPase YlqF n=1 Tax=Dethiothermospora halolimnae TaxID=3114390 RepID=UPI003CCBA35B